jgi:predicted  nucleic acid-binding Zn-ribbon protein
MSQTLSLYRLQQVDIQLDRVHARLESIQNILDDDAELRSANERAEAATILSKSADLELMKAEADAQNQRIKIEQTEASLYGGKGHSPKELQDLQNDVAALKRHLITLEDIQLEAMMKVEKAELDNKTARNEMESTQQRSTEQNRGLENEKLALQKELDKLLSERAATTGPIPQDALITYDKLRQQRRGLAVAVINDSSCSACGAGLTAAQMQSSRTASNMAFCPSCGRILYGS